MGHPPPSVREWRAAIRGSELSRTARQFAFWLTTRPGNAPGQYLGGQTAAAHILDYGERAIRQAQSDLVTGGWLTVAERGVRGRTTTFTLALPD